MGDATIPLVDLRHAALKAKVPAVLTPATGLLSDRLGRPLRDLRISVTDRCNFRCSYCMPKEVFDSQYRFLPQSSLLSFEEITRTARPPARPDADHQRIPADAKGASAQGCRAAAHHHQPRCA